jgi:hypothetical protein
MCLRAPKDVDGVEEDRLKVLRKILGRVWEEVTVVWREKKVKGRKAGFIQHCSSVYSRLFSHPSCSSFIHLQRRHHTKRRGSPLIAKEGTFEGIYLASRNSLQMRGSFTCRKVGTWDVLFNFPSEGRHAEDFYIQKNPTASAGFELANSGTRDQHVNH